MKQQTTTDGSKTFRSSRYQQTYHSCHGAQTEAMQVYLNTSGIAERLAKGAPCAVLEIGFGLGLNYLLTADLAASCKVPLSYVAYEHDLITSYQFRSLDYCSQLNHPNLANELEALIKRGQRRQRQSSLDATFTSDAHCNLTLHLADVATAEFETGRFDAVYLDAFSPDTNPECWTLTLFRKFHQTLKPGGILTSYCVKGTVRRGLETAGFDIERLPGPPGKREILRATAVHKSTVGGT